MAETSASVFEQVRAQLAPYLGDFNAKIWVQRVAERDLGLEPDALVSDHLPTLMAGLRPSLNTFFGRQAAGDLVERILREVG